MFNIISTVFKPSRHFGRIGIGALAGLALFTLSCSRAERTRTGLSALHVPQGFKVERVGGPDLVSYPMMGTIDDRGRLFLCESSGNTLTTDQMKAKPDYRIRMLTDTNHDGVYDHATTFADKLTLPAGAVWYRNALYVAAPPDVVRLEDTNGDGVADKRDVIVSGWHLSANAASLHGPFFGPDGWLYLTDGRHGYDIKGRDGRAFKGEASRIWRVRPDGTGLEWVAGGGFDNPVELVFLPTGETFGTMTYFQDPANGQRDALMHWVWGGVYPKWYRVVSEFKLTGDLMPVMTKFARIAPAGLLRYVGGAFGGEYRDNLFSAQFNPHRVQRHILHREGATFRTDDADFLTSADPDFHPTDVMEDADGSLLVLDTGAWFINGCPISRVAKPEIRGGIYRISKIGAPPVHDARGEDLKLSEKAPADLILYLEDPRPAVRDRVQELLANAGDSAVQPLMDAAKQLHSYESRSAAVWALYRIGTPHAEDGIRAALDDPDFRVRIAAARAAGMAKDGKGVDRLRQMVLHDEPGARRQAATALGQIGDKRAVPDLIAASHEGDRFVEHSVTYALIELKTPAALTKALHDPNSKVRKTALIALDQMDESPLKREQIRPFLQDRDQDLHKVGLWVVSHHPDWSNEVLSFLEARLAAPKLSPDEAQPVRDAVLSFCDDAGLQKVVAKALGASHPPAGRPLFLLDTIDGCSLKKFPETWTAQIGKLLDNGKPDVQLRAINLIRSQQIKGLEGSLQRIANTGAASPELRIAALGALTSSEQMSDSGMQFLLGYMSNPDNDAGMRLSAAQVIGRAKLGRDQLLALARGPLSKADSLVLPNLLSAFHDQKDKEVGEAMVRAVLKSQTRLGEADAKRLADILQSYPDEVRASARPIMARLEEAQKQRVEHLQKLYPLLSQGGDIGRGRRIFFGDKVSCFSCHTVGKEGGHVGPDLTSIGAIRSGEDILEAIIFPSASFVPGFEPYTVVTHDDTIAGVRSEDSPDSVTIITGRDSRVRVRRSDIVSMKPSTVSLMPDGLDESLTRSQLADLLAFLRSQTASGLMPVQNRAAAGATPRL
jgi:putative membrane-bound dehydrogenase-like protein